MYLRSKKRLEYFFSHTKVRKHCLSTITNTTKIGNSSVRTASRSFVSRGFRVCPVATATRVTSSENLWKQEDFIRN